jgi:salicylate hydroxylase
MRAIIIGAGMGGLCVALALREAGVFTSIDVYEQTATPSTAGAGLNIAPNGARLVQQWLGVDLDGGDPRGPHGALDGGRAAILEATREILPDGTVSRRPIDHDTAAKDGAGFHHMHRMDLLMCLHRRVRDFAPETGAPCPIRVHMARRLVTLRQDGETVTAGFADGTAAEGDLLVGADGVNSTVLKLVWPKTPPRRWTQVVCYRGLVPRAKVAALRKSDGSPLDHNPVDSLSMDARKTPRAWSLTYWVRGAELLNVWMAYYSPEAGEFGQDEADWFPADRAEILARMSEAFDGDPRKEDVLALAAAVENPTKWGLYDRDAFDHWHEGRICLLGDAAHPMLPTMGQAASQAFEDAAALSSCFRLHGSDVYKALLHYERVRHYRATRFQFASKFLFKHLEPEDSPERRAILKALDERDYPLFNHDQRAGNDMNWIYAFDARNVGDKLPLKKLGPWDFRARKAAGDARREIAQNLWVPPVPLAGDRKVTRDELARHATFEDCWIVIRGKVYDFTEWKDRHPGGPFVARMYAGKDATAEFGDFHSPLAERHMAYFCVGELVEGRDATENRTGS